MKTLISIIVTFAITLFCLNIHAESKDIKKAIYEPPKDKLMIGVDKSNSNAFFLYNEKTSMYEKVAPNALFSKLLGLLSLPIKLACTQSPKPETITASVGILTVTWNVEDICKSTK